MFGLYETIIFKRINLSPKSEASAIFFRPFPFALFFSRFLKTSFFRLARRLFFYLFDIGFLRDSTSRSKYQNNNHRCLRCTLDGRVDEQLDEWRTSFFNHSSSKQSSNYSIIQFYWRGNVLVHVYVHGQKWKNLHLRTDSG